jgi:hypothetical protein
MFSTPTLAAIAIQQSLLPLLLVAALLFLLTIPFLALIYIGTRNGGGSAGRLALFSRTAIGLAWASCVMTFAQAAANLETGRGVNAIDYSFTFGTTGMALLWATAALGAVFAVGLTVLHLRRSE